MGSNEKFGGKILVLDDERLIRMAVCARLKIAGYETVSVGTIDEAVAILKKSHRGFSTIISDIMMGDMDGFVFRDIVRGIDSSIPFFFMTALDPEEGSGFLKKILADPMSYYLPKSAGTEVLVKRLQRVVGARRIQQFVTNQVAEQRKSLALAAHVQRSMLPARAMMDAQSFYTTWWRPHESVSGDLYEAVPVDGNRMLFVLGDIQGHGTNAALVMMAVQAFLRQVSNAHAPDNRELSPEYIANQLQGFFRSNFADISYMTATICIYAPADAALPREGTVSFITCGTADLVVVDSNAERVKQRNPGSRGGLPIGLMPDTVYTADDVVLIELPSDAVCIACTDGLLELSRDEDGQETMPLQLLERIGVEVLKDAGQNGAMMAAPYKFMSACIEFGYDQFMDDVTLLVFGARRDLPGIYETTTPLSPALVDIAAQQLGAWCAQEGWPEDLVGRVQLVLEEHLMNIYDHGFSDHQRRKDVVSLRLRQRRDFADLTVWDCGQPPPSLKVAAGVTETALDLVNNDLSNHGRGRLMVRQLCDGIQRQRFGSLNETVFHIPTKSRKDG